MLGTVGIVGAGQLSQMLAQASSMLGLRLHVLASSATEAAAQEPGIDLLVGSVSDPARLREFLSPLSVCGFESELIDTQALRQAAQGLPVRFVPSLDVMSRLSEKLEQKRILRNLEIPTAPFSEFESSLESGFEELKRRFGTSFVVKWSKFGYDGRGVLLVDDEATLSKAKASCKVALSRGVQLYAETRVDFVRELALIGCHSTTGDFAHYPLVISEQEHGICRRVRGPAVSLGVNERFERLAVQYAEKIAKSLPLHGTFGIEFFETQEGELWVNEIAPRVHNSGHYTQDACPAGTDQFGNHLRAISGQMLGTTQTSPYFAMLNLLGPQGARGRAEDKKSLAQVLRDVPEGVSLHWYNKDELFPGRKLGHLNCTAQTAEELASRVRLMEDYEKKWVEAVQKTEGRSR